MSTADAPVAKAPELSGPAPKILAISAPYYKSVVDGMLDSAKQLLAQVKAEVSVVEVSGAFELPQALSIAVASGQAFDGYIVLGCVVRGETDHYEFICASTLDGLLRVAADKVLCLGTAVLTVDTLAQAVARSHETGSNKGAEAAAACLKQIALKRKLGA
jgi:6,7-dimethyl-8-ribityllumazine synthase